MWTADALRSEAKPYACDVWRLVESQAQVATVRITDTLEEQYRLEQLLDQTKPKWPTKCAGIDFLLATPFRYWPYPNGSRFRRARQPDGAFYAAEDVTTAVAELSFYRLLFFAESPTMTRPKIPLEMSAFAVAVDTDYGIDLTKAPFGADAAWWGHPTDYGHCQDFADAARNASIEAIRYRSVRCPKGGMNVAVLDIDAFSEPVIKQRQTWHIFVRETVVQAWCESPNLKLQFDIQTWAETDRRVSMV